VHIGNDDRALLPGMYAQVKFGVTPADAVWLIPATALVTRTAGPQVLSVGNDGTVHYQSVQLGRDLGPSVEILSGLTGKERLVINAPDGVKDGTRVAADSKR
jgi:multidrug efflux pump subunit AcrA (membrane-fusion protein)